MTIDSKLYIVLMTEIAFLLYYFIQIYIIFQ